MSTRQLKIIKILSVANKSSLHCTLAGYLEMALSDATDGKDDGKEKK